jgi:proteasome lid subunit RPN8/RPN11
VPEIPEAVVDALVEHMRAVLPNEGCGYLVGDLSSGRIDRFLSVANSAPSPTRFVLDPLEQLAAEQAIEAAGEQVVGIAHSHPTGVNEPSATDIADAGRYDPFGVFVHAIVDPQEGSVRRFRIVDGAAVEFL